MHAGTGRSIPFHAIHSKFESTCAVVAMAKKSKKGRRAVADARGYSTSNIQRPSTASSSTGPRNNKVAVTAAAHEGLTSLLADLKGGKEAASLPSTRNSYLTDLKRTGHSLKEYPIDPSDSRFVKRVSTLHDRLLGLTFTESQIESALTALGAARGSDFDLELALDWLCLHLPSASLPSLFIEQEVQVSALEDGGISVDCAVKNTGDEHGEGDDGIDRINGHDSAHDLINMVASTSISSREEKMTAESAGIADSSSAGDNGVNEEEKAKQKALLLAQYQYEEEEGDEEQEGAHIEAIDTVCNSEEAQPPIKQADEGASPQERQLADLEAQIEEDSAILNDDAALYMMSKYEIADLKKRIKKSQGQAKGLRGKVAKIRAERERKLREEIGAGVDDEEDGAGAFSLFGGNDHDDSDAEEAGGGTATKDSTSLVEGKETTEPAPLQHLGRSYGTVSVATSSIPKDWHGQTPKKLLEDHCRKQKMPAPTFSNLPHSKGACKLVLQKKKGDNQPFIIEHPGPFYSFNDAQHYLATEALYELSPSLPLYRLMPPIFRTIWMTWQDEEKAKRMAEISEEQDRNDADVQALVGAIYAAYKRACGTVSHSKSRQPFQDEEKAESTPVLDDWDDQSSEDDSGVIGGEFNLLNSKPTPLGAKLSKEYAKKTSTPAYQTMLDERKALPIYSYRQSFLETVNKNPVTVLCAATGAGKSTNAPLFLLEEALESGKGERVNIICTQPRRVAAISVAERVSEQMNEKIGGSIGYHIRMESKKSKSTKLMFCTTGVILRRLQDDPTLKGVTHVCVDEVHERQWQIDFLLISLRRLISTTRKDLKIVLMSATIDSKIFCQFFSGAPFLDIPGRTFPVSSYYLEDLLEATGHIIEEGSRCAIRGDRVKADTAQLWVTGRGGERHKKVVSLEDEIHHTQVSEDFSDYSMNTRRSMERVDEKVLNYELIEDILGMLLLDPERNDSILLPEGSDPKSIGRGSVLVFLPGMGEIRALTEILRASRRFGNRSRFDIIPMHSSLSPKDQRRAFLKPKAGCQKIILATNICETSITIPDVVCVVDTGLMREVRQEKRTGTSTLVTAWCSRANAKQRSGRAGRVQAGLCCKLFSSRTEQIEMHEQPMPELQRVPLEEACLSILAGNLGQNCMDFLLQAPQPPSEESVKAALLLLEEVGAIESSSSSAQWGERSNERLTPLGKHLAKLPVHVRLGKILIMGALLHCLDDALTIAASLSTKSPFSTNVSNASEATAAHRGFSHPSSDFISICNVWKAFETAAASGFNSGRKFCDKYFLNHTALVEISDMRDQFLQLLRQIGFVPSSLPNALREYSSNSQIDGVIDAVVVAGLYPNIVHADKTSRTDPPSLWYRKERVHFHSASINHKVVNLDSVYCAFYEKFAFGNRTYIAATSLAKPFSLMLFGKSMLVRHLERKVLVDDFITLKVAAQTGVAFRELRYEIETLLQEMISSAGDSRAKSSNQKRMVDGVINLLANESGTVL